ncbi:TPA: pyridine nucleotide-disulfide oxidoreductase, partial [Enterococcus faecium]|nr:pyridine nucleotide-disulfide oxidoreductase [Enterococcus faecium]HAP9039293.1 pyridine nucleotide-disulfide oxidoreductase [Enterococcus faecium]
LCSQEDLSGLLSMFSLAIEEQITLDKLKMLDYLFHPSFSQPYNFILKAVTGLNIET